MAARMGAQKFPGMGQKHLRLFQVADMPLAGKDAKLRAREWLQQSPADGPEA